MAMRTAADELLSAKYSHVERERRWLVDAAVRPALDGVASVLIEDRYIRRTRCRLRRMTSTSGESTWKLTKKYDAADPLERLMVTAYLSEAEHAVFAALPADTLTKRRYSIDADGACWSLDRFEGALGGLELVEIEAPTDCELRALEPPPWAAAEVSFNPAYQGGSLAVRGLATER